MAGRKKNIRSSWIKAVLGMVLSFSVLFSAFPVNLSADGDNGLVDPTENREGYAAYLYDNT
ncbi:MAG: hypothetical protein IKF09_05090, partial [Clostridiales bacterium]|nr:hypothetical protein [Clostridiales bacterium]